MYVDGGAVRLSVVSDAGKEAATAVLEVGRFFGEGCLASQPRRMATATAMAPCTISVEKPDMVRELHARPPFADRFLMHMLTRNIRIEEDLIDQLFNSSETRLAARSISSDAPEGVSGNARRDGGDDAVRA